MSKYNVHIGGLTPDENRKVNEAVNSGKEVKVEGKANQSTEGKKVKVTQTVHQYGANNYTFDKPVSGFRIGDDYTD